MNNADWTSPGRGGAHEYAMTVLSVFWPRTEHARLIARWPHLVAQVGRTYDEHQQQVERFCALVDRQGHKVNQTAGNVAELEVFLKARRVTHPSEKDLLAYPDLRHVTTPVTTWPPARTGPCWCGSGRRYKQCCRRYGLGTLD